MLTMGVVETHPGAVDINHRILDVHRVVVYLNVEFHWLSSDSHRLILLVVY
jgi:hypothetical protein